MEHINVETYEDVKRLAEKKITNLDVFWLEVERAVFSVIVGTAVLGASFDDEKTCAYFKLQSCFRALQKASENWGSLYLPCECPWVDEEVRRDLLKDYVKISNLSQDTRKRIIRDVNNVFSEMMFGDAA